MCPSVLSVCTCGLCVWVCVLSVYTVCVVYVCPYVCGSAYVHGVYVRMGVACPPELRLQRVQLRSGTPDSLQAATLERGSPRGRREERVAESTNAPPLFPAGQAHVGPGRRLPARRLSVSASPPTAGRPHREPAQG